MVLLDHSKLDAFSRMSSSCYRRLGTANLEATTVLKEGMDPDQLLKLGLIVLTTVVVHFVEQICSLIQLVGAGTLKRPFAELMVAVNLH